MDPYISYTVPSGRKKGIVLDATQRHAGSSNPLSKSFKCFFKIQKLSRSPFLDKRRDYISGSTPCI